ncbi:MAG: hypothetical protein IPJ88_03360 [Myxococcales bacterium]|nr:MAG: hypothetical protein IPJ88_03360 [Myxococcales bacterium]
MDDFTEENGKMKHSLILEMHPRGAAQPTEPATKPSPPANTTEQSDQKKVTETPAQPPVVKPEPEASAEQSKPATEPVPEQKETVAEPAPTRKEEAKEIPSNPFE